MLAVGLVILAGMAAGLLWYIGHPDRPLWQIQARLKKGETVELIGATGKPAWSRWWIGGETGNLIEERDGTFVVDGWPLTLLELLPDTCGQGYYRIHAEVRHLRSGDRGAVGLYFAGTIHRSAKMPVFSYLHVHFNDVRDAIDQHRRLPDHLRKVLPQPRGNQVTLASHYFARPADRPSPAPGEETKSPLDLPITFTEPELFKPSGHAGKPGEWRTIMVEVSPAQVRVFWEGKPLRVLPFAKVDTKNLESLEERRQQAPDNPALDGLVPGLDPQGGLGLCLHESYASFRNVRVEPFASSVQK
jgi:serine/threonine-protein kinase